MGQANHFESEQYDRAYPPGAEHHWWHVARSEIVFLTCEGSDGQVLDVGCGRGIVVSHLREKGIDCRGVELGLATPLPGVEPFIRVGTNAADLPRAERQQVTTILLLDVLEHVAEPAAFLRQLLDAFPSVTRVIVTVPARPELWSEHDDFYGHYARYTLPRVGAIADAPNVRCSSRSYFFRLLYPPFWLAARLKLKRDVTTPTTTTRWLHRLLAKLLVLEYRLLPRRVAGTSIIAVLSVAQPPPAALTAEAAAPHERASRLQADSTRA